MTDRRETNEQKTQFRVIARRHGVFRDTLDCVAIADAVLKRTSLAIDLLGSNSLAFFYKEIKRGDHVAVAVARRSTVQPGDIVTSQWVTENARAYRRWTRGKLGHIPNMRYP